MARRKKSGRSRREDVEFADLDRERDSTLAARRKLFSKRTRQCAGQGCENTEKLGPTAQNTNRTPDFICSPCRFQHFNVPEDFPPATKQDWRIFNAGYLDEKREDPVRESQASNRWYHAGRMTAIDQDNKAVKREKLLGEVKEKVDEVLGELKETGGSRSVRRVVNKVLERMGHDEMDPLGLPFDVDLDFFEGETQAGTS